MIGYLALIIGWIAHVLTLKGKQHKIQKEFEDGLTKKNGFLVLIREDLYDFESQGNFLLNGSNETARVENRKGLHQLLSDIESRYMKKNDLNTANKLFFVGTLDEILPSIQQKLSGDTYKWKLVHIHK